MEKTAQGDKVTAPRRVVARDGRELSNTEPALRRCWHPVARSASITETPTKAWLLGEPLVVVRLAGNLAVFYDRCPHRFAPLSAGHVVGESLVCAYHGWSFDTSGRCVEVPSLGPGATVPPKALCGRPFGVIERYGLVFVALEEPIIDLPELEFVDDPTRVRVELEPFTGRFGAAMLIDNQLDVAHFAFIHRETFGCPEATIPPPYELDREAWGFGFEMQIPIAARHDPGALEGTRPIAQYRTMRYRYRAPFHVELMLSYPAMSGSNDIIFFVQPETEDRATMYITLSFAQDGGLSEQELAERIAFEYRVIGEDLDLQAQFDRLSLPLELTAECHVRVDRASVEFRRILAALVATISTSSGDLSRSDALHTVAV